MEVSVIISTYNAPKWLEKVLWGFESQHFTDFEIVIADDGSAQSTTELIRKFQTESGLKVKHVWQEDNGFQKCKVLNKAILASEGTYLVFTDGDCIPRSDFLEQHVRYRQKGYFLSGGYCKLNRTGSEAISRDLIQSGTAFDPNVLESFGLKKKWNAKHCAVGVRAEVLNKLTTTKPTWNGHNASCYKYDAVATKGFDERMGYGGEDREFGERLFNRGLKSKQIRYSAICIHLDHERSYVSREGIDFNKSIRSETKLHQKTTTDHGISS